MTLADGVALAVSWTELRRGDAVLLLSPAPHALGAAPLPADGRDVEARAGALRARGLQVTPLAAPDLTRFAALEPGTAGARDGATFRAALLFDATLFTPADVEEIHRLRLRRLRHLLAPGGWLVFGDGETFGEPTLERPRLEAARLTDPSAVTRRATLYTAAQARLTLEQCGFTLARVANGWTERQPYAHHEPGMVFVCRRA